MENQAVRERFISFIIHIRDDIDTKIEDLRERLKKRDLSRVPLYLLIGFSIGLVSTTFPQDSILRQTGTGAFTASTIFSLHEIIHSRIHQMTDKIAQFGGSFWKIRDNRSYIISISIILMDILVAVPMFAYREYSRFYTEWVTACLFLFSYFLIVSWLFLGPMKVPSFAQESLEYDERANSWNQMGMISVFSLGLFVCFALLILLPAMAFSPIGWQFSITFLISLFVSILPFVFIDSFHYMSATVFLFNEHISSIMKLLDKTMHAYAGLTIISASIVWILLFQEFYSNLTTSFDDTPPDLVIILMGVSWTIIGIMGILPYIVSACQVLKSRIQKL